MFVPSKYHIGDDLHNEFHKDSNASTVAKLHKRVYSDDAMCEMTCRGWFLLLQERVFDLENRAKIMLFKTSLFRKSGSCCH